jgi:peptidoglycan/LPS O-acetylase OafA/YrhL
LILAGLVAAAHLAGSPIGFLRETALLSFYGCILLLAVRGSVPILKSSFLRFFGTISYTLYLVHQSALVLLHVIVRHRVPSAIGAKAIFASSGALVLSIGLCWISWVYFERPVLAWARRQFDYRNKYFSKKRSASAKAASQ